MAIRNLATVAGAFRCNRYSSQLGPVDLTSDYAGRGVGYSFSDPFPDVGAFIERERRRLAELRKARDDC